MLALFATIVVTNAAPDQDTMMAKEKSAWQAFKDKDAAAFQKVVAPDMVGVYSGGISGMKDELADMKTTDMKSFDMTDFKGHMVGKDVFVTSYQITTVEVIKGTDTSVTYYAGSVWKMEKGEWLAIFHTNAQKKEAQ
jgi:hypothetical protein